MKFTVLIFLVHSFVSCKQHQTEGTVLSEELSHATGRSIPGEILKSFLENYRSTNAWSLIAEREVLIPANLSSQGIKTRAIFAWLGESQKYDFWPNSVHFESLLNSHTLYFVTYDAATEAWNDVKEFDAPEIYKKHLEVDGWCNRGFMGTAECTPPIVQVLRFGLGKKVSCSVPNSSICFSIEVEITRNKESKSVEGEISVNFDSSEPTSRTGLRSAMALNY